MDLRHLTRDALDDRLRIEAGVDVLAGRPPTTRLVVFGRDTAVLSADARPRRPGEPWIDHLVELAYLARVLRPRGLALGYATAPDTRDHDAWFALHVVTVQRRHGHTRHRVEHREHPFQITDDRLLRWKPPRSSPAPPTLDHLARTVMRRPRGRGRHPGMVTELLVADGYRVQVTAALADRVAGSGAVTVVP